MQHPTSSVMSRTLLAGTFALLSACGGDDSPTETTPPVLSGPSSVQAVSGSGQSGVVATELSHPLVVEVSDRNGEPVSGSTVSWSVSAGEGSLGQASSTTDAQGRAQVTWTLGTETGEQSVTAQVAGVSSTVSFAATAEPGEPTQFIITPESVALQTWGDSLQLSASLADQYGNAIVSETATWSSSAPEIVSVDESGWARSYWAARPGTAVLTARAGELEATVSAEVIAQANTQCQVLMTLPAPGPVAGVPSFTDGTLVGTPAPKYYDGIARVGDFDGDGFEDIVVFSYNVPWDNTGNQDGEVLFWRNDGTGSFTEVTDLVLEPDFIKAELPVDAEVADFNGDGALDVYAPQFGWDEEPYPGAPNLLLLSGAGGTLTNRASTNLFPYETTGKTHSSASADVDCDGDIDIYEGDLIDGGPHLMINNGSGSFAAEDDRLPPRIASSELGYAESEFGDVDRDGDQDLFLGEIGGSGDALLINNGFGDFRRAPDEALPAPFFGTGNITIEYLFADFDLDGWQDLLVAQTPEYADSHLLFWRNNGDGTFTDATAENVPQPWQANIRGWISQMSLADFNGDGWPDVLADRHLLINQGGTFIDATGSVYGLHDDRVELRDYSTFLAYPIDADGDKSEDILVLRGWYRFQEGETTSAMILRNTN